MPLIDTDQLVISNLLLLSQKKRLWHPQTLKSLLQIVSPNIFCNLAFALLYISLSRGFTFVTTRKKCYFPADKGYEVNAKSNPGSGCHKVNYQCRM